MRKTAARDDDVRDLYRELILDHAKQPRHFGKLASATHSAEGINPLCGDKLRLYLDIDADEHILDAAFEGTGCAISVASASLLTDDIIGLDKDAAVTRFHNVVEHLTMGAASSAAAFSEFDKMRALEGVREYPARVKCATLAWHALRAALNNASTPASTE